MLIPRLEYEAGANQIVYLNVRQRRARDKVRSLVSKKKYRFEKVPCAICKKKDFKLVCDKDRYGLYVPVVICITCGLVQTNPRMDKRSYDDFYKNHYTKLYMANDPADANMFDWQRSHGKQVYEILKKKTSLKNKKVVEIGCGPGGLLSYFKERGCKVSGFEPHAGSVDYGKKNGIDLKTGFLKDFRGKADIIIYSHVMEHILDPVKELSEIKKRLNKGGLVYIEVPSIDNVDDFFESDVGRYFQNAHVYHFTENSLKNLASVTGFEIIFSDKFTHSIWRVKKTNGKFVSDYVDVLNTFRYLEKRRKNIFDLTLLKKRVFRNGLYFLRATHLDQPLKKIYFKIKKGGEYSVTP